MFGVSCRRDRHPGSTNCASNLDAERSEGACAAGVNSLKAINIIPATGTKHTLKPLYSLDCRGFLVLKLSIPAKIPAKDNFPPKDYICALLIGGGGSLWLSGIVTVPAEVL